MIRAKVLAAAILADALAALLVAMMALPVHATHGPSRSAQGPITTVGLELDVARGQIIGAPRVTVTEFDVRTDRRARAG
jgi:hypothetical protein